MRRAAVFLLALSCSGGTAPPAPDPTASTALFRFNISDMVRNSPSLPRPPVGNAYGNLYLSEDVSVTGPRQGAMAYGSVAIALDLTNGISDAGFTTPKLEPGMYTFLGYLDTDDDGGTDHSPSAGDIATLPTTNAFTVTDAGQAKKTIVFDLIYN
jgi:hypothetical protein